MFNHSKNCISVPDSNTRHALVYGVDIQQFDTCFESDSQRIYLLIGTNPAEESSWILEKVNVLGFASNAKITYDEAVADEAARLALTDKPFGYVVFQEDDSQKYVLINPASIADESGWADGANAGGWNGTSTDGWVQDVYFEGLWQTDTALSFGAAIAMSLPAATKKDLVDNFSLVTLYEITGPGVIRLWCSDYAPGINIPLILQVIR